jgi:hypothetical protein
MKLPFRERAYIAQSKVADYLLSQSHPVGRWKAKVFRTAGFDQTNLSDLEEGLLSIVRSEEVSSVKQTPHGTKYVVEGEIGTPSGRRLTVRTVWIIESGTRTPRLVTAYAVQPGQEEP